MDSSLVLTAGMAWVEICKHGAFSCADYTATLPGEISKRPGTYLYFSHFENNCYVIKELTTKTKNFLRTVVQLIPALIELDHENIMKYFGLATDPGSSDKKNTRFRTASLYYPGGTLSTWAKQNKCHGPRHDKIRSFLRDLLQGLKFLHSFSTHPIARVVHCDIKPDNLVLKYEVQNDQGPAVPVVIIDLEGAAINENLQSETETTCHTPRYAAPELLFETGWMDFLDSVSDEMRVHIMTERVSDKTDIWSVGCVAIQLCTGKEPVMEPCESSGQSPASQFTDNITKIIFQLAFRQAKPKIPDLGNGVENQHLMSLIQSCLEFGTKDRKTAVQLLEHPYFSMQVV